MSLKKIITAVALLSSVLSFPSSAYFGESIVNSAYDTASSAALWVKENPGKTVAAVAGLAALGVATYWGLSYGSVPSEPSSEIDPKIDPKKELIKDCAKRFNVDLSSRSSDDRTNMISCLMKTDNPINWQALNKYINDNRSLSVDLNNQNLTVEHLKVLGKALQSSRVYLLDLADNDIDDEASEVLLSSLKGSKVSSINLSNNKIGDRGAASLCDFSEHQKIVSIALRNNQVGDEGAQCLTRAFKGNKITFLHLDQNPITDKVIADIDAARTFVEKNPCYDEDGNLVRRTLSF